MNHVPIFPEPLSVAVNNYEKALIAHSIESHKHAAEIIKALRVPAYIREELSWLEEIGDRVEVEILATGSDGRTEKATFLPQKLNNGAKLVNGTFHEQEVEIPSKMDIQVVLSVYPILEQIALTEPSRVAEEKSKLTEILLAQREKVLEIVMADLLPLGLFEEEMEVKLAHEMYPSGYLGKVENPWPSRTMDASSLTRSEHNLDAVLRRHLLQEVQIPGRGKKLKDTENDRAKQYLKVCTGRDWNGTTLKPGQQAVSTSRGIRTHFDIDEGMAYYERKNGKASFKYGPLRVVQMYVSTAILSLMLHSGETGFDVQSVPHSTADKLRFLTENNRIIMPDQTLDRIIENYIFFLRLYHQSEWASVMEGSSAFCFASDSSDRKSVSERLADLAIDVHLLKHKI